MGPLGLDPVRRWARSEHRDPTIGVVYGKVARAMMSTTACYGRIKSPRGGYDGQSIVPQGENCQVVYSSMGLWHHMRGLCLHQGSDPRKSSGRPRWAPIKESGGRMKHFKGAPRWD